MVSLFQCKLPFINFNFKSKNQYDRCKVHELSRPTEHLWYNLSSGNLRSYTENTKK